MRPDTIIVSHPFVFLTKEGSLSDSQIGGDEPSTPFRGDASFLSMTLGSRGARLPLACYVMHNQGADEAVSRCRDLHLSFRTDSPKKQVSPAANATG